MIDFDLLAGATLCGFALACFVALILEREAN